MPKVLPSILLLSALLGAACGRSSDPEQAALPPVELPPPIMGGLVAPSPATTPNAEEAAAGDPAPWLRLYVGHSLRGGLEACGCPGLPSGGLARRAVFADALGTTLPGALLIEGPDLLVRHLVGTDVLRGEDRARARLVLELLAGTKPLAWAPGQRDLEAMPPAELAREAQRLGLTLLATNLAPGVLPGARPFLTVESDGRKTVILSLLGPARTSAAEAFAPRIDTIEAAARALHEAAREGPVDLLVALTDTTDRDRARWLDAGLDVDVLVVPPGERGSNRTDWLGDRLIVRADPGGRSLIRLDAAFTGPAGRGVRRQPEADEVLGRFAGMEDLLLARPWERARRIADGDKGATKGMDGVLRPDRSRSDGEFETSLRAAVEGRDRARARTRAASLAAHLVGASLRTLDTHVPEDEVILARIRHFQQGALRQIDKALSGQEAPPNQRFAGRDACITCHAGLDAHWAQHTQHAEAWKHLVERGQTRNPDCLRCHTTGFGILGGFADPDRDVHLRNVQCEACHGPMATHAAGAGRPGYRPPPGLTVTEAVCLRCHDPANSPEFDFAAYLPRVVHPR